MNNIMQPRMYMELFFPSELGYEIIARDAVAAFARRMGFPHERIDDLKTAMCEACINAIEHGNMLKPGLRIQIACEADNDRLKIEVRDQGLHVFETANEPLSIADKLAGRGSLRGMGLMIIAQLADESGFVNEGEIGNCFRFTLYRTTPRGRVV